tara:strand:- start:4391 stop:4609 length:219 start_codon:yes stop_codon:yes gene_type:complete
MLVVLKTIKNVCKMTRAIPTYGMFIAGIVKRLPTAPNETPKIPQVSRPAPDGSATRLPSRGMMSRINTGIAT